VEAPERITPRGLADYLEVMTRAVFQSGMSWRVIEAKWDGFREAFHGFDPERVAALSPEEVDDLGGDTRIIRNRRKIQATVENAETLLELDREHGGFDRYLDSFGGFEEKVAALRKEFRFLGDFGAYYLLYVVGHEVPAHDEYLASRGKEPLRG
jgi:3-methyladenine DNA glycosylase Tag